MDPWASFAQHASRMQAPLYAHIARCIQTNDDIRELASHVKPGQPPANILLGAVHYLLLRGALHPLARFYPTVSGGPTPVEDPFAAFQDFVAVHREEIAPLVATRVTNTNEVGRSALLNAGFRALAAIAGQPLHGIELGPSAGFNLLWDRYAVRYHRSGEIFRTDVGDPALELDCDLHGDKIPPLGPPPHVASRIGLELHPVNLADPQERDWLRALV
ncbi:MAG: DUF2332 family protein, partial [Cyanobacteria bacterium REEB65]|nr:DUF2332 family protein [Cyanobacteria bacterium REEB65]